MNVLAAAGSSSLGNELRLPRLWELDMVPRYMAWPFTPNLGDKVHPAALEIKVYLMLHGSISLVWYIQPKCLGQIRFSRRLTVLSTAPPSPRYIRNFNAIVPHSTPFQTRSIKPWALRISHPRCIRCKMGTLSLG